MWKTHQIKWNHHWIDWSTLTWNDFVQLSRPAWTCARRQRETIDRFDFILVLLWVRNIRWQKVNYFDSMRLNRKFICLLFILLILFDFIFHRIKSISISRHRNDHKSSSIKYPSLLLLFHFEHCLRWVDVLAKTIRWNHQWILWVVNEIVLMRRKKNTHAIL